MSFVDKEKIPHSPGYLVVGKVKDAHGIKGELFILLFAKEAAWLNLLEKVHLVLLDDQQRPTFVQLTVKQKRFFKNGLIIKTTEITDRNGAEKLKGAAFEVPESFFNSKPGEGLYLREILDFDLYDEHLQRLGKITGFSSNNAQDLAIIEGEMGSFEVPLVEHWILSIDKEKKIIKMTLPEGLVVRDEKDEV